MREIKFRGKTYSGKWIYGSLVYSQNVEPAIYFEKGKGEVKWMDWLIVNPDTIDQFTGLKDVNGVEVYEGDICQNAKYPTTMCVVWDAKFASFCLANKDGFLRGIGIINEDDIKVIGNIHDNPELLK